MPEERKKDLLDHVFRIVRVQPQGGCISQEPCSKLLVEIKNLLLQRTYLEIALPKETGLKTFIVTIRHSASSQGSGSLML